MSKKALLTTIPILLLIPLLAVLLVPRFLPSSALADRPPEASTPSPLVGEGWDGGYTSHLNPPPLRGEETRVRGAEVEGPAELEVVGRWPYGPAWAVQPGTLTALPTPSWALGVASTSWI